MRRLFWIALGLGAGAAAGVAAGRWASRTKQRYSPPNIARQAGAAAGGFAERLRGAVEEGRAAMEEREAELRAQLGLPG